MRRSGVCVFDPNRVSEICANQDTINVKFTRKSIRALEKMQKSLEDDATSGDQKKVVEYIGNGIKSSFEIGKSVIDGVTCAPNNEIGFDQMLVLATLDYIVENDAPPVTYIKMKKGKCEKFVNNTFLTDLVYPNEVFDDMVKMQLKKVRKML